MFKCLFREFVCMFTVLLGLVVGFIIIIESGLNACNGVCMTDHAHHFLIVNT